VPDPEADELPEGFEDEKSSNGQATNGEPHDE
jgi:hypothetical protein